MAKTQEVDLLCPACGQVSVFVEHLSIQASRDQAQKQALLDGSLYRFTCAHCQHEVQVDHPLVYDDAAGSKLLIAYDPSGGGEDEEDEEGEETEGARPEAPAGVTTRVVHLYNDLVEKILLGDAGIDDRAFEVLKLITIAQDDTLIGAEAYFEGVEGDDLLLTLIDEAGTQGARVPRALYERVRDDLTGRGLLADATPWLVVDRSFALDLLEGLEMPS